MIPTQPWYRRLTCWLGFHQTVTFTDGSGAWCPLCGHVHWEDWTVSTYDASELVVTTVAEADLIEADTFKMTGGEEALCPAHKPIQHRDGKEPWCAQCGLTAGFTQPGGPLA